MKKEAELLVQRLQKEIDKLKMTIDELETDPELKVSIGVGHRALSPLDVSIWHHPPLGERKLILKVLC